MLRFHRKYWTDSSWGYTEYLQMVEFYFLNMRQMALPEVERINFGRPKEQLLVLEREKEAVRPFPGEFIISNDVASQSKEIFTRFHKHAALKTAGAFVAYFPHGKVISDGLFVSSRDNRIFSPSMRTAGSLPKFHLEEISHRRFTYPGKPERFSGKYVVLGNQSSNNYFHWLIESMSKLSLLDFLQKDDSVRYIIQKPRKYHEAMLSLFGIGEKQLFVMPKKICEFEHLIFPSRGLSNINTYSMHAVRYLQRVGKKIASGYAGKPSGKRIYISRSECSSRRIVNEEEVIEVLVNVHGFTLAYPETLSFTEQCALFGNAEIVCGPFGAGLANSFFMSPGSTLMELVPEQRDNDAVIFQNICAILGIQYCSLVAPFAEGQEKKAVDRRDFVVELELLNKLLKAAL